jgi:1-phosphatidylinositol phosphodiesterase
MNIRILLSAAISAACCVLPVQVNAQVNVEEVQGGYSHDSGRKTTNTDWVSRLPDSRLVSWVSWPGTHDTMALIGGTSIQTQSMSLSNQLQSGIRALDIRCRSAGTNTFYVVHGAYELDATFGDVLDAVTDFLKAHPREAILLRLKKEDPIFNGDNTTFENIFNRYAQNSKYSQYFWVPPKTTSTSSPTITRGQFTGSDIWGIPTDLKISDIRGKIVILQEFVSTTNPPVQYGIPWNSVIIQDNWNMSSNWALYDKWLDVRNQLNRVNTTNDVNFYGNFLTGNIGSYPYFVASGKSSAGTGDPLLFTGLTTAFGANKDKYPDFPRLNCVFGACSIFFLGTNELSKNWLIGNRYTNLRRGQMNFADFPGPDLITSEINFNFQ